MAEHETQFNVVGFIQPDGTQNRLSEPRVYKHRPHTIGTVYEIIGPDNDLALHNCSECRANPNIIDNRPTS